MKFNIPKEYEHSSGIYIIRNSVNDKVYVGSAVYLRGRFYKHRSDLRKNTHDNSRLQNFTNKYGIDTLSFDLLEICNRDSILETEQKWMDYFKSYDQKIGFNITPTAGSNLGYRATEETKKKISEVQKGVPKLNRAPARVVTKTCITCKKEYSFPYSKQRLSKAKFCSKICQGIKKRNKRVITCTFCGNKVECAANQKGIFCSNACHGEWRKLHKINTIGGWNKGLKLLVDRECLLCNAPFKARPSDKKKYCSYSCSGAVNSKLAKGWKERKRTIPEPTPTKNGQYIIPFAA